MSNLPPDTSSVDEGHARTFAEDLTGAFGSVLEAFDEPAWLLSRTGTMLFANESARSLGATPDDVLARARLTAARHEVGSSGRIRRRTRGASAVSFRSLRATSIAGAETALVLVTAPRSASRRAGTTANESEAPRPDWGLPPSLAEVAALLVEGLSSREIAEATGYSLATSRVYVQRIYERLDVHSRLELVAWARARGLT